MSPQEVGFRELGDDLPAHVVGVAVAARAITAARDRQIEVPCCPQALGDAQLRRRLPEDARRKYDLACEHPGLFARGGGVGHATPGQGVHTLEATADVLGVHGDGPTEAVRAEVDQAHPVAHRDAPLGGRAGYIQLGRIGAVSYHRDLPGPPGYKQVDADHPARTVHPRRSTAGSSAKRGFRP